MMNHRRLVAAPISWGICEVPGWGRMLAAERVLGEMASLGLTATELGAPGFLPDDPATLRETLRRHGLDLVASFWPVVAHEPSDAVASVRETARKLAALGGDVISLALVQDLAWSAPRELSDRQWETLAATVAEADAAAAEEGVTLALHPHEGTLVYTAPQVERALAETACGWCLDTGHLYLGGVDPAAFAAEHAERVVHVHLKDVDAAVAARAAVVARSRPGGAVRPAGRRGRGRRPRHRRARPRGLLGRVGARAGHRDHRAGAGGGERACAGRRAQRRVHRVADPGRAVTRRQIGIGVIGLGWLGHAHSRSMQRIRTHFEDRTFDPVLAHCADTVPARRDEALGSFGFASASADWRAVIDDPAVEVVVITAPNMLHLELIEAAAQAGKHVFCEKPVGGTPAQTARAEQVARHAGVITGVGYNYRWAPLVRYAKQQLDAGALGTLTNYRGRFFSMYGADPLGLLSWRFRLDEGGYGVTSDLLSHAVDLAHFLIGPITRLVGTVETFIRERPIAVPGAGHYGRGRAEDPHGEVTNEDYAAVLCEFADGTRGTFEASRAIVGPESQMAFDVYGTEGALGWNLEDLNRLRHYRRTDDPSSGYTTVYGGDRFPYHGAFVPGAANGIGFEDLVVIEDLEYLRAVVEERPYEVGFAQALEWVSVQAALLKSVETGRWEDVLTLRED